MSRRGWNIILVAGVSATLVFACILVRRVSRYLSAEVAATPFDRKGWMAGWPRDRVGMARHLVDRKALDGMTRADLVAMLGEPDVEEPGRCEGTRWFLGSKFCPLFDETLWLEVTVGEDGKVESSGVGVEWSDAPWWR